MSEKHPDYEEVVISEDKEQTAEPPMYKVLLHNDDFTTKAFVVNVLVSVFNKSQNDANQLMWRIHRTGIGVCGIYPFEIAETKVALVSHLAREHEFPLRATLEAE